MKRKIRKLCGWCNKVLEPGDGIDLDTTHCICPVCAERFERETRELEGEEEENDM